MLDYDRRHGYRGPEGYVDLPARTHPDEPLDEALHEHPDNDDLLAAVVLEANPKQVKACRRGGEIVTITGRACSFAAVVARRRRPRRTGASAAAR